MTLLALLSTCAMIMGLGGIVPQLVRMVRTRSAGGQATIGWALGAAAHASMTYVNLVGFHSLLLGAYSVTAGSLCAAAMVLIATLRRRGEPAAAPAIAVDELRDARSSSRCARPSSLEIPGRERVAVSRLPVRAAALEPRTPLRRRAVRERVGVDLPAGLTLQAVVPDRL